MTRVLAIGAVLPEFVPNKRIAAYSYRMEQLIRPLLEDDHEVIVCGTMDYDPGGQVNISRRGKLTHFQLDADSKKVRNKIWAIYNQFKPECIIGVCRMGAIEASMLEIDVPIWIDLYGSPMCEGQAKSFSYRDDSWVSNFWMQDEYPLLRGDAFSTCGHYQEHFTVGQLSMLGRLNKATFGYKFVHAIPPSISAQASVPTPGNSLIRGRYIANDDFALLWCGGYNVWTDIDTLFKALEDAFALSDKIKFISLGGCIEGHDDLTYPAFQRLISNSKYKDRYNLLGWRNYSDVIKIYSECDLGISIDRYHYEPIYGTRTRLVEMIQNHLPVITSLACELSYVLEENQLALSFDPGNSSRLTEQIIQFSQKPKNVRTAMADHAYRFFLDKFTHYKTTEPLRAWVKNPLFAPDKAIQQRPILLMQSNIIYMRNSFQKNPEDHLSLKRLLRKKIKAKTQQILHSFLHR
ncbi:MAG: hypothetical protein NT030_08655 [Candidatus Saganbacteria bacterium]|nr:hypothetical protein [Candidatus Saganbacteria bacterium]